jgi:hypothetical protein
LSKPQTATNIIFVEAPATVVAEAHAAPCREYVIIICSIIGLAILPAGRAIVLAYTMPLWAIPIGLFLWREPLGRNQLAGAAVAFAGLGVDDDASPRRQGKY